MKKDDIALFYRRLADRIPEPETELEFVNHYTLLVAVVLSAQATDAGVNAATRDLFAQVTTPQQMLELGEEAPSYHTSLARHLDGIDGVYCVGPLMHHLYSLVPKDKCLGWHEDPATLEPQQVASLLRGGDVVVVKGSKKMFWVNKFVPRLVAALQARA